MGEMMGEGVREILSLAGVEAFTFSRNGLSGIFGRY